MSKNKIYMKIDNNYNVICVSDDLRTIEFQKHRHVLTDRAQDPSNPEEWEWYDTRPVLVERTNTGDGCTVHYEHTVRLDDIKEVIEEYLKTSWYILKINEDEYATSLPEMQSKIMGPLDTEHTILMSDEKVEYRRDRRIYLPR